MLGVANVVPSVQYAPVFDGADRVVEVFNMSGRGVNQKIGYVQALKRKLHVVADFAASENLKDRHCRLCVTSRSLCLNYKPVLSFHRA